MRFYTVVTLAVVVECAAASPSLAQRLPFERSFDMSGPTVVDVSTARGKIDISAGQPGKVVVHDGWDKP